MGRYFKFGLLAALGLLAVGVTVFWQDLRVLMSLRDYVQIFEPEKIDENFRTLYEREPAVRVPRSGPVYVLPESLHVRALPTTYEFEGETRNLREFLDRTQTTGLAVLQDGELIHEEYNRGNTRESRAIQMSVSKGMASFLIGVALEEGVIEDINDLVTKYAPSLADTAYEGVTIKQVLEMSSGVRWTEDYGRLDSDLVQSVIAMRLGSLDAFTASVPRENDPGTYNRYASIDTHALGMVLRGATGIPYKDYFEQKLWSRLGAEDDAFLLVDTRNEPLVFGGVNIRLRDMIRFGELYRNMGRNHLGEQLVSRDWVETSTTPDSPRLQPMVDNPESDSAFGYKYQWWIPLYPDGDDYSAIGIYGQFIYINPARKIVIAKTSAYTNYTVDGGMVNHETLVALQNIARHLSDTDAEAGRAQ